MSEKLMADDAVHTEDGIPVRRLHVKLLKDFQHPEWLERLKNFFSFYGEIEDIKIYTKVNYSFALVTMSKYGDAAYIIRDWSLKFEGQCITRADSWRQPPLHAKTTDGGSSKEALKDLDGLSLQEDVILKLNDDCLLSVFEYLNVFDLISIEATCTRFKALVQPMYKHKYQNVDFQHIKGTSESERITLMEARSILMQIGYFMKNLKIQSKNVTNIARVVLMIPKYCSNLKSFKIFGRFPPTSSVEPFIGIFNNLTSLSLVHTQLEDSFFLGIFNLSFSKLKSLNVSHNNLLRGRFLSKFHNLESIELENCSRIQSCTLIYFCQRNSRTLTTLNISGCVQLKAECFEYIVRRLTKLKSLVISNYYQKWQTPNLKIFANIPNLKKLKIVFVNYAENTELLSALTEANRLEHFDISNAHLTKDEVKILYEFTQLKYLDVSRIQVIDDKAIKMFAERNKQLHTLNLCGCCCVTEDGLVQFIEFGKHCELIDITHNFGITNSVIPLAVAVLNKGCGYSDNKKLKMIVGKTRINRNVLLADYMKNQNKLQLSFDSSARGLLDFGSGFEDDEDSDEYYVHDAYCYYGIEYF